MKKWLPIAGAWVASDWFSLLQLGWLKGQWPAMYDGVMNFVMPISMGIHTFVVATWNVTKDLVLDIAANTS
jgi:hypothetical protein